jgi:hypothetical protein
VGASGKTVPTAGEAEAVRARILRALRDCEYGPFTTVGVDVSESQVCLGGQVTSYYLKQVVQSNVLAVIGGMSLRNDIVVAPRRGVDSERLDPIRAEP